MITTFEVKFSCYENKMSITMDNGNLISTHSSLVQYMNEPFVQWCDKLIDSLYDECGDIYQLTYCGRVEEAEILQYFVNKSNKCKLFAKKPFLLNDDLQHRMIKFSEMIKTHKISFEKKFVHKVVFLGNPQYISDFSSEIQQLDVENPYCRIIFDIPKGQGKASSFQDDSLIIIDNNKENSEKYAQKYLSKHTKFILLEGEKNEFLGYKNGTLTYSFSRNHFFEIIFKCLFVSPLLNTFVSAVQTAFQLTHDLEQKYLLTSLLSTKPIVSLSVEQNIELGCHVPVRIKSYPTFYKPQLVFLCQFQGIVKYENWNVYALSPGETNVDILEKGETVPILSLHFRVYTRNRIKNILLSNSTINMGKGDVYNLQYSYEPIDADNIRMIEWKSDNTNVAKVDRKGGITSVGIGECNIYCRVENVMAACHVISRPYLEKITLPKEMEEKVVEMKIGEEMTIMCDLYPSNAHDSALRFSSTNLMVVNIIDSTIKAVSEGKAIIIVENETKRLQKSFVVKVHGEGKGILGLLFGRRS